MSGTMQGVLFFGYGYCARALTPVLAAQGVQLTATCRDAAKAAALTAAGITPVPLDGSPLPAAALDGISHVLLSAAPGDAGDPALPLLSAALADRADTIGWLGYLSTTGVYGDHGGAWIDEATPPGPLGARGQRRVDAEAAWDALAAAHNLPLMHFRLAGIYGPGRNQLAALKNGTARRIDKPGQVFSRIHVDDIAAVLAASMHKPDAGRAYTLCDDAPAPPQDVVAFAAALLQMPPPPLVPFAEAELSPMARSFYGENKRLKNDRIKSELGVTLAYPDYRAGLTALFEAGAY